MSLFTVSLHVLAKNDRISQPQSDFLVSPNPLDKFRTKCIAPEMIAPKFQIYCTRKKKLPVVLHKGM